MVIIKEGNLRITSNEFTDHKVWPLLPFYDGDKTVNKSIEYVTELDKAEEGGYVHEIHGKAQFRKNSLFATGGAPAIDAFHFRINKKYIYYTESPAEAVVLGAVAIKNIVKI